MNTRHREGTRNSVIFYAFLSFKTNGDLEMEKDDVVEIKQRLTKIEVLLSEQVSNLSNRVTKLENNQAWLVRTLIGSVVLGLVALLGL